MVFSLSSQSPTDILYTDAHISTWWWIPASALILYLAFGELLDLYGLQRNKKFRETVQNIYEEKSYPSNRRQVYMMYGVAVIVGISEEVFYRSYLPHYLQLLGLPLWAAVAAMIVIFALGHFPQGTSAVISSGINGLMYWLLFTLTGNLLLPILLHIAYDARIPFTSSIILKQKENHLQL